MERGSYRDDYVVISQFSLGMGVSRNGCIVLLHAVFCVATCSCACVNALVYLVVLGGGREI